MVSMNPTLPISVFIIALNESDRIGRAIISVRDWVDEVIVIDSGSTDNTVQVATALGARVMYHEWPGYGMQKRFGEDQCKNKWLLNIDADEEITPALVQEIQALFAPSPASRGRVGEGGFAEPELTGYVLRVRDLLPGEKTLSAFAHTNFVLRLYNREKARFSESPVHDTVRPIILPPLGGRLGGGHSETPSVSRPLPNPPPNGEGIVVLKHPVLHRSFRSLAHAIDKMNDYSNAQAENLCKRGLSYPMLRLLTEFPVAFFKDYILRGYILRGRRGFINAVMYAFTRFIRIAKYMELKDQ